MSASKSRQTLTSFLSHHASSSSRTHPRPSNFSTSPSSSAPATSANTPARASSFPDLTAPEASFGNLSVPSSSFVPRGPRFPEAHAPQHKHINFPERLFLPPSEGGGDAAVKKMPIPVGGGTGESKLRSMVLEAGTGLTKAEIQDLTQFTVVMKRVVNMTKKGKMPSYFSAVIVGSPRRGLVGIGQGRGETAGGSKDKALHQAILSMDHVNRFEQRTLWGAGKELSAKWGATTVFMRGRPAGFGLAAPPALHRILTACGVRDCSATIEGSRNPMQVVKAGLQILHGGAAPPKMGNGSGTSGPRANKGYGMRSRDEVERERGRWGVEVGRKL